MISLNFNNYNAKSRISAIGVIAIIIAIAWIMQLSILSSIPLAGIVANLPLTLTIVWGLNFGSAVPAATMDDLRTSDLQTVLIRQFLSGSISGALVGACFAALYSSVLPVFPLSYPLIGWVAGYFCLRNLNQALVTCLPLVLILSFLGELVMACQLHFCGRPDVFGTFMNIAMGESVLNALIAPFVFIPLRGWDEFNRYKESRGLR